MPAPDPVVSVRTLVARGTEVAPVVGALTAIDAHGALGLDGLAKACPMVAAGAAPGCDGDGGGAFQIVHLVLVLVEVAGAVADLAVRRDFGDADGHADCALGEGRCQMVNRFVGVHLQTVGQIGRFERVAAELGGCRDLSDTYL